MLFQIPEYTQNYTGQLSKWFGSLYTKSKMHLMHVIAERKKGKFMDLFSLN